mmetsp:Transcript_95980/g.280545  ORF Transcript_95980/g.280545 Transcript_95980/m.280545 type:complete len:237 (-) Transcript_95980:148-858(-)
MASHADKASHRIPGPHRDIQGCGAALRDPAKEQPRAAVDSQALGLAVDDVEELCARLSQAALVDFLLRAPAPAREAVPAEHGPAAVARHGQLGRGGQHDPHAIHGIGLHLVEIRGGAKAQSVQVDERACVHAVLRRYHGDLQRGLSARGGRGHCWSAAASVGLELSGTPGDVEDLHAAGLQLVPQLAAALAEAPGLAGEEHARPGATRSSLLALSGQAREEGRLCAGIGPRTSRAQ